MTAEPVFNLFLYCDGATNVATEFGVSRHEAGGTDDQKIRFLQLRVADDFAGAARHPVPRRYVLAVGGGLLLPGRVRWETFSALMQMGRHLELFEEALAALNAPRNPLCVVTAVVDGKPVVEDVKRFGG